MNYEKRKPGIKSMGKTPEPKLCPQCLRVLKLDGKRWLCEKHGEPDRP